MSRHPFIDRLNGYRAETGIDDTAVRHLRNTARIFAVLKEDGRIQSENPSRIAPGDVTQFVAYRREGGASFATVRRDLRYLDGFLAFCGNDSVSVYIDDLRSLEDERIASEGIPLVQSFLDRLGRVSGADRVALKAYVFVALSMVYGLRPEQVRKAFLLRAPYPDRPGVLAIQYHDDRSVKRIEPDLRALPILRTYIDGLTFTGRHIFARVQPLFPSKDPLFTFIGPEESRALKRIVEDDLGTPFDYRTLQKAFRMMSSEDAEPSEPGNEMAADASTHKDRRGPARLRDMLFRRFFYRAGPGPRGADNGRARGGDGDHNSCNLGYPEGRAP